MPPTQIQTQAWLAFLTPLMLAVVAAISWWNTKKADKAALSAQAAKEAAQRLAIVADKTHMLVNSQMGQQLMIYARTARELASLTKNPEHIVEADEADRRLREHIMKQHTVDDRDDIMGTQGITASKCQIP